MNRFIALSPLLILALAACGKESAEAPADDRRGAEGEVLGGTISDAMLPLDTIRSQSPPLSDSPGAGNGAQTSAPAGEGDGQAAEPAPEPAAEPIAEESDG